MYAGRYTKYKEQPQLKKINTWDDTDAERQTKRIKTCETFPMGFSNLQESNLETLPKPILEFASSKSTISTKVSISKENSQEDKLVKLKVDDAHGLSEKAKLADPRTKEGQFVQEHEELIHNQEANEVKIMLWNVNSLNTKLDRKEFLNYVNTNQFDIMCFNETKYSDKKFQSLKIDEHHIWHKKFHQYWHFSTKKLGYSGVCILSKLKAISCRFGLDNELFDSEGRCVTVEFENFFLICVYAPCSGIKLERLDDRIIHWEMPLLEHVKQLKQTKHVILIGDLNVAHTELDVANLKKANNFPGYTPEERGCFSQILEAGFIDSFRELYPFKRQYSWWDQRFDARRRNDGWRLDYCVVNKEAMAHIVDVCLRNDVYGSDHCPLEVVFKHKQPLMLTGLAEQDKEQSGNQSDEDKDVDNKQEGVKGEEVVNGQSDEKTEESVRIKEMDGIIENL
jgi:exodeoxyribonuclease-3